MSGKDGNLASQPNTSVTAAEDYFTLFGLARAPQLSGSELAQRYRRLQSEMHPDRYAAASTLMRQLSLQQASRINDAYAVLKNPLRRAAYLLSLYGVDVYNETDTALPPDFLMQQLEWREAMSDAEPDERALLLAEIQAANDEVAAAASEALTQLVSGGAEAAEPGYDLVRRWIYLDKLLQDFRS